MAAEREEDWGEIVRLAASAEAGRRSFAAYFLKMISGFVLYQESGIPSQRRTANICKRWIYSRSRKHVMTFESVCEIFDLDPAVARETIRGLHREDLLRKAKTCYEEKPAQPEERHDGPDDPDSGS